MSSPFAPRPQPSTFTSTPILQQPLADEDEPEVIRYCFLLAALLSFLPSHSCRTFRLWRERQAEEIKAREDAAAQKRQETISKAERSIDQFYEEYTVKKERNIKENKCVFNYEIFDMFPQIYFLLSLFVLCVYRQQELDYMASLSDSLSNGTTWSRICELLDLQNSQSKTIARAGAGTTDLTRFKEVLLRLKREGDSAPGAAGY